MNRNSPNPDEEVSAQAESAGLRMFQTWRHLLNDCAAKPTAKRVHALRVNTMRLQATLDSLLADNDSESPERAVAKRWKKRARRLRRRLSVVRSFDVHLINLAHLRDSLTAPGKGRTQSARASLRQLADFERQLKLDRRTAARKLALALRDRLDRLSRRSLEVAALLPSPTASSPGSTLHHLIAELQIVLAGAPKLDAGSLHGFRKQIKKLRYVAEPLIESDPRIAQFAKALKAMQDAIGEWHDWQTLAKESARVFASHTKQVDLTALMEARVAESLQHALRFCESSIAQLIPRRAQDGAHSGNPPRKRAQSVAPARAGRRSA
jgi:CHAD domain-containing protein